MRLTGAKIMKVKEEISIVPVDVVVIKPFCDKDTRRMYCVGEVITVPNQAARRLAAKKLVKRS